MHCPAPCLSSTLPARRSYPTRDARPATPYLRLHVGEAVERYRRLARALPGTAIHYAVKANPEPRLLAALQRRRLPASTWPARRRCSPR